MPRKRRTRRRPTRVVRGNGVVKNAIDRINAAAFKAIFGIDLLPR